MKIHRLDVAAALASLETRAEGLSEAEARRRLAEFGPNVIEAARRTPLLLRLAREFVHLFALILWVAAALAFFAEWQMPGQGMGRLGVAIVGVILINGVFSFWQEYRAERTLTALSRLLPRRVRVLRDGAVHERPAEELVPGDIIHLSAGDAVPADARLIAANGLRVNVAAITGESVPRMGDTGVSTEDHPTQARNVVLAGTTVVSGSATAVIFATGMRTVFGTIAHLAQRERDVPSPLLREIARMSRLVAVLATVLGIVFFFIGRAAGMPFWADFLFAIGIIVANVPEGLLPTVTLSLALATQRMARRRALVRHLPAVEALGAATVIVTDKTGTLTENRMAVVRIYTGGRTLDATAADPLPAPLVEAAGLCHELEPVRERDRLVLAGDPMEQALVDFARQHGLNEARPQRVGSIPFDANRKRLTTVHTTAQGLVAHCKGAPETVLPLCSSLWAEDGPRPLDAGQREALTAEAARLSGSGLRVLAFAFRTLPADAPQALWEVDLVFLGLIALRDPPRPEVPAAVRTCREAGIRLIMVTGDHPATAAALAREIGLSGESPRVVTGGELAHMTPAALQLALDARDILFARVNPEQKLAIVEALRRKGQVVAVTGDGVNDAPALRAADIGIAMGRSGTDVAREAADLVLLDDNFATIVAAIEEGRAVYDNIRKFLTYILSSNIPEIVPYLAFALFAIPLPLTVMQILAVDLGTDLLPALALGAERPDPQIMRRPPRPRTARLLDAPLLMRAYLWLGLMEAAAALGAFFHVLLQHGWHYGEMPGFDDPVYRMATTACLSAIVVMQVANVFLCRSPSRSLLDPGLGRNPLLYRAVAVEIGLILLIDYTPWGQALFGTADLPVSVWLTLLPAAAVMVLAEEARKAWRRGC